MRAFMRYNSKRRRFVENGQRPFAVPGPQIQKARAKFIAASINAGEPEMIGDAEKMIAVGLVWGSTNAVMRRGALIWDQKLRSSSTQPNRVSSLHQRLLAACKNWLNLLLTWQYSVPFLINLSASATFFAILSDTPISLAVPVTNATTFAATAVAAMLLGEETRVGLALLGTFFIVLGVWICIM